MSWNNVAAGTYSLTARATDNAGATTTSTIVSVSVTPSGTCSGPTSGLVACWKFDENSGTTATDSSGTGNTGTANVGHVMGRRTERLGSQFRWDKWSSASGGAVISGDDQYGELQRLIYPTADTIGIIVNKEGEYEVARFSDGTIQWAIANSTPGWAWTNTGGGAPVNQWTTCFAVTHDGGVVKTYLNGTLTHTYNGCSGAIGDVDTMARTESVRIGGR